MEKVLVLGPNLFKQAPGDPEDSQWAFDQLAEFECRHTMHKDKFGNPPIIFIYRWVFLVPPDSAGIRPFCLRDVIGRMLRMWGIILDPQILDCIWTEILLDRRLLAFVGVEFLEFGFWLGRVRR